MIQTVAAKIQNTVHKEICDVVSNCLATVFPDPYKFRIDFVKKRGKTEAIMAFERDGLVLTDPKNCVGGGVVDIAVFALRVACILRSRPRLRRIVFLDEPFKHLHSSLRPIALKMLRALSIQTGLQFVIVTHLVNKKKAKKFGKVIVID